MYFRYHPIAEICSAEMKGLSRCIDDLFLMGVSILCKEAGWRQAKVQ